MYLIFIIIVYLEVSLAKYKIYTNIWNIIYTEVVEGMLSTAIFVLFLVIFYNRSLNILMASGIFPKT